MTSPFQSIIATPENAVEDQVERNECNSYSEEVAEIAAISIAPDEPPSAGIEKCAVAKKVAGLTVLPPQQRSPLRGGVYTAADALKLINSHYFIGKNNQETAIFRVNDDGSAVFVPPEQFKLEVQNIFVKPSSGSAKPVSAESFGRNIHFGISVKWSSSQRAQLNRTSLICGAGLVLCHVGAEEAASTYTTHPRSHLPTRPEKIQISDAFARLDGAKPGQSRLRCSDAQEQHPGYRQKHPWQSDARHIWRAWCFD